jgi:hypothetical protein
MNRRTFLRRGLTGGVLLALGGGGLALWPTRARHLPRRALESLDERRFAVLAAIAERIVRAPGADPTEIAHRVDATLAKLPDARHDIRQLLLVFENALVALLLGARPQPFTHLSPERQDALLEAWRGSRLAFRRSGYQALRKLTLAAHYSSSSSWESVGYPGPPTLQAAR